MKRVLRATAVALKKSKSDIDAQHVRVVALLKLDRYDDAIQALEAGGEKLQERASLEKAYALYKVGRLGEAAQLAKREDSRGMKHVEAQAVCLLAQLKKSSPTDSANRPIDSNIQTGLQSYIGNWQKISPVWSTKRTISGSMVGR